MAKSFPGRLFSYLIVSVLSIFNSSLCSQTFNSLTSRGQTILGHQCLDSILEFLSTQVIPISEEILLVSEFNISAHKNFSYSSSGEIAMAAVSGVEKLRDKIQTNLEVHLRLTVILFPSCIQNFFRMIAEIANILQNVPHPGRLTFIAEWPEILLMDGHINFAYEISLGKFLIDSQIFVLFIISNNHTENPKFSWHLHELYCIKDKIIKTQSIATVDTLARGMAVRRADLSGITIAAGFDYASSVTDPHMLITSRDTNGTYRFENGSSVSIYRDLKQLLNFSEFAQIGRNGSGFGPIEELFNTGKADISITRQRYSETLASAFHILHPTTVQGVQAFCLDSTTHVPGKVYWSVFDGHVWICIFLVLIVVLVLCNLLTRLAVASDMEEETRTTELWIFGLYAVSPGTSVRIVNLTLYLAAVVISATFSAKLASQLTIRLSSIQSFEDLINNDYKLIHSETSASLGHYAKDVKKFYGNRPNHRDIIISPIESNSLISVILANQKTALLTYPTDFHRYYKWHLRSNNLLCTKFSHFEVDRGFVSRMGFVVPKRSPFKELFNHKILILTEFGLIHRYNAAAKRKSVPACPKITNLKDSIEFSAIGHAGLFFIGGIITAEIILILEKVNEWQWQKRLEYF